MAKKVKTMEEFLDKAAIDTGSQAGQGKISVVAELKESRVSRVYDLTWTYKGSESFVHSVPQISFDPEDNEKISDYLNDRVVEVEKEMLMRGIDSKNKGHELTLYKQTMPTGTAADMLNSAGTVAPEVEFVSLGKEVTTGDIYRIGRGKRLTPEDVLLRIKTYNEKQLK